MRFSIFTHDVPNELAETRHHNGEIIRPFTGRWCKGTRIKWKSQTVFHKIRT
jgi:hypothetical protein